MSNDEATMILLTASAITHGSGSGSTSGIGSSSLK